MRPESLELESKSRLSVSQSILQKLKSGSPNGSGSSASDEEYLGGVIRNGQLAWIAFGSNLEVFSIRTGQRVAGQSFDEKSVITSIAEVTSTDINSCLLIIGVQKLPVGGLLYLFSVQGSRIIRRIDVVDKITSCCFISDTACKRSCLKAFNGCAAVGTDAGEVFLIDLNINRCKDIISRQTAYNANSDESSCRIVCAPIEESEIKLQVKQTRADNINLGIRLDVSVIEQPSPITSIMSMAQMQIIVIGLENGLLGLFNLCDLNALHLAFPPEKHSPLVKLTFLEPADDPRPCVYIWALHANKKNFPFAVMHSVSFNSKAYQDGEILYETFQWCRADLTIPIEKHSTPISCQSVTKIVSDEEDEQYSLCLLSWTNRRSSFVLVFDLNQWYKEQMPKSCDWRKYPSYLAPFPVELSDKPLDIWLNPKSVVTFNSIQRPEEHFYPTSLSFDLVEISSASIHKLHWAGLQNNAIRKLSNTGAVAILVPDDCFVEFLEASLIPQMSDQNYHANPSKKMKQEFLLSMALEYNCMGLLRECAQQWADGSHMGRHAGDGLTLSTLTDWIWDQATQIKDRCNDLCVSLFDDSGITLDLRSRKILAHYSRQLKLLADLLNLIITNYRQYIPDEIFDTLTKQRNSIRMTSEYQEVLQWLLNMGLLPEIVWNQLSLPEARNDTFTAIPYPYRILNKFYTEQRQRFYDIDRSNITPKTNSCKCLYIDSFIERECNPRLLRDEWNNGLGDGLYPPPSLQSMLRILLIPGIPLENKYMLFVYLFLDLHMVLEGEHFGVVQNLIKFPAVFKLNSSLIKTTQAFWNLDHNEYEIALKELISPLTSDRLITQWQQELLVNTLLIRDMPNLALQAVRAPGPSISTSLRVRTLLANNLITEAFELQRTKFDESLLLEFFKGCHDHKKWNYVLGLSLTDREGDILCKFLKTCDSLLSENLQLLYLLQRNKYIDALIYLDDLKHKERTLSMHQKLENTQDLIISSYKLAMNKTNRTLCDQYMAIKHRLPVDVQQPDNTGSPLSSQLNPYIVDANANVVGSVFHRAIVAAKRTGFSPASQNNHIPLLGNLRIEFDSEDMYDNKPIAEPTMYIGLMKRRKEISYENMADPDQKQPAAKRQRTDSFSFADQPLKRSAPGINNFLLTSLTNQSAIAKKQATRLDFDESSDIDNEQRNSMGELCETENLLSTPVVKSSRLEKHSRLESRCHTPQSILKQRHTEIGSTISRRSTSPSLTVNSARRSVDFNAKPFCYTIPAKNEDYRLGAIQESGQMQEDDDSSSQTSPNSIKGRRPIHSGKSSSGSNSVDEFYSPETSKVEAELERSNQDIEHDDDISRISHQAIDIPACVQPRRKLRSTTPEVGIMSSTRITRSRSKQNLNESVDYENVEEDPKLNTSTPKRVTPRRSPGRSLSKNVITSNAMKVHNEAGKLNQQEEEYAHLAEESRSLDAAPERNLLKDASDMSILHTSIYSTDELDATQAKQNHLHDSSSFASDRSGIAEKLSDTEDSTQERIHDETEERVEEQSVVQPQEQSNNDVSMQSIHNEEPEFVQPFAATGQIQIHVTKTMSEQTTITETRLPHNLLADSSAGVSDSLMQKYMRHEHCTSSFFSETPQAQNLLEDSSVCTPSTQETADSTSNVDSVRGENIDDIDDDSKSVTSNQTISSDTDELRYDEVSDKDENDDEVISIASSSSAVESQDVEEIGVSYSQDQDYNQYEMIKYDLNSEFAISQPKSNEYVQNDDYNITELQTTAMPTALPSIESGVHSLISQEQAMNEMIYGDLGADEAEILNLDMHTDAVGFEMHGNLSEMNRGTVYLNEVEITSSTNVQPDILLTDEPTNGDEIQQIESNLVEVISQEVVESTVEIETVEVQSEKVEDDVTNLPESTVADDIEPMDTEMNDEPTNVEHIDTASPVEESEAAKNVSQAITEEIVANEEVPSSQSTEVEAEATKPKRRARRIASQTEESKNEINQPDDEIDAKSKSKSKEKSKLKKSASQQALSTIDEPEETKKKSGRTSRARSQQPVDVQSVESTEDAFERKKRAASEKKTFKITLQRVKIETESAEEDDDSTEHKRAVVKKSKSEEEPSTSKTKRHRTKSVTDSALGDKFDAEESVSSRRLRKATSHQSLSDAVDSVTEEPVTKRGKSPGRKKAEGTGPRRAASHQSLSSISDNGNEEEPVKRTKRTKSVSMQELDKAAAPRTRRASSQQHLDAIDENDKPKVSKRKKLKSESTDSDSELGDRFDADESAPSRSLRKAVSHQTLAKIVESAHEDSPAKKGRAIKKEPATPRTTRRASSIQSLSSLADDETKESVTEKKTRSRKRTASEASDTDKVKVKDEPESPSSNTRSRRGASESKSPKETRKSSKKSSKKDDDTNSEASSIVSIRSRKGAASNDDDASSVKSSRVRPTRSGPSALPAIAEDEASNTLSQEYLESSRLTRSQRATIEKYSKKASEDSTRRKSRKTKAESTADEQQLDSDHSDTESVLSQRSTVSKSSRKSKTSEASTSQRSTRQRAQKK